MPLLNCFLAGHTVKRLMLRRERGYTRACSNSVFPLRIMLHAIVYQQLQPPRGLESPALISWALKRQLERTCLYTGASIICPSSSKAPLPASPCISKAFLIRDARSTSSQFSLSMNRKIHRIAYRFVTVKMRSGLYRFEPDVSLAEPSLAFVLHRDQQ